MIWVIVILAVIAVVSFLFIQVEVRHRPSFEGIEDPSAVRAYDRLSRMPQFAAMRGIFTRELGKYNPQGTLADVGCGPGYLLQVMADKFPHLQLVGVDIAKEILNAARRNLKSGNVEFKQGDSQKLPFALNSIDFIVSTLSLHHWAEPEKSFAEIHRVLKPKGQYLIFDLRRNPPILSHMIVLLATALVVPSAIRRISEPLGSLRASYTPGEVGNILSDTPFTRFCLKKGFFWLFAWGKK